MKTILVTGGAGFIPSHLVDELAKDKDAEVVSLDNLLTGHKEYITHKPNVTFVQGSANNKKDLEKIFSEYKFDYVFHYAAVVGVERTQKHPLMVLDDIDGFKNLLSLCQKNNVKRVYFSSSSEVYGESYTFPQDEQTTPLNSRVPYAIVKSVGEAYLKSYNQEHGLEYTIFRFFNTYGPRQSIDFVMSRFIDAALADKDITLYGDGEQTRTFCYIGDNIAATTNAFRNNLLVNDTANIGSDIEITIKDLAQTIINLTGSKSKIVYLPPLKEGDMPRRLPTVEKMLELLGRDFTPIEEGIKATLENMKNEETR